ncbi:MAG: rhodanese-like domain-containing protein [Bacillota bacterium]
MGVNRLRFWKIGLILLLLVFFSGCSANMPSKTEVSTGEIKDNNIVTVDEFEIIRKTAHDYLKKEKPITISARELYEEFFVKGNQSYYIIDIRGNSHFAQAHIPGSVNIPYADSWRELSIELLPKDKKIVIVCYSGHTSSQTAAFWGMLGYDAVSLENGMAGWSSLEEVIGSTALACEPLNYPLETEQVLAENYPLPTVYEGISNPAKLIEKRSEIYLAANYAPIILAKDLQEALINKNHSDLFLVDVRNGEHYKRGYISSSINIPLVELVDIENLKKLPPDKKIVLIGYDGHDASQAVRILTQLGYNAVAMKDGIRIWNGDEILTGIEAISCTDIDNLLTEKLNYIPKTDSAPATCGG